MFPSLKRERAKFKSLPGEEFRNPNQQIFNFQFFLWRERGKGFAEWWRNLQETWRWRSWSPTPTTSLRYWWNRATSTTSPILSNKTSLSLPLPTPTSTTFAPHSKVYSNSLSFITNCIPLFLTFLYQMLQIYC